ncbi:hypothetical protein J6590_068458 [Homalodisca vitripennis]|nr:hypothetical protein J6590_068458 [Homalodisca vitripennis]
MIGICLSLTALGYCRNKITATRWRKRALREFEPETAPTQWYFDSWTVWEGSQSAAAATRVPYTRPTLLDHYPN